MYICSFSFCFHREAQQILYSGGHGQLRSYWPKLKGISIFLIYRNVDLNEIKPVTQPE